MATCFPPRSVLPRRSHCAARVNNLTGEFPQSTCLRRPITGSTGSRSPPAGTAVGVLSPLPSFLSLQVGQPLANRSWKLYRVPRCPVRSTDDDPSCFLREDRLEMALPAIRGARPDHWRSVAVPFPNFENPTAFRRRHRVKYLESFVGTLRLRQREGERFSSSAVSRECLGKGSFGGCALRSPVELASSPGIYAKRLKTVHTRRHFFSTSIRLIHG